MQYVPPFEALKQFVQISTVKGEVRVSASYEDFLAMLRMLLAGVEVDEAWYRRTYEDIDRAVQTGEVISARQHFISDGYFEGRIPAPIEVDEAWYLTQYPDVAESVRRGEFRSAQHHFQEDGYREGRLPFRV
ncbi:MAG TPA: hypothetical protein VFA03_13805 [Acetobacteraceae bacterium]|nr:hypothetical protein [Acetobacteraceae bacterium]